MATYPYDIQSIAHLHSLPLDGAVVNVFEGVHSSKGIGIPIDPQAVLEAEHTVQMLSLVKSRHPASIGEPVLESARNRAHLLRHTHACAEFRMQPDRNAPVQQAIQSFEQGLTQMEASIEQRLIQIETSIGQHLVKAEGSMNQHLIQEELRNKARYAIRE